MKLGGEEARRRGGEEARRRGGEEAGWLGGWEIADNGTINQTTFNSVKKCVAGDRSSIISSQSIPGRLVHKRKKSINIIFLIRYLMSTNFYKFTIHLIGHSIKLLIQLIIGQASIFL